MKANRKFVEEDEAVSAVIGVILMVAITVAIAATVYLYVSGFFGGGIASTPTVGMSAEPSGSNCVVTLGSPTAQDIDWSDVIAVLVDITDSQELVYTTNYTTNIGTKTGVMQAGQVIVITGAAPELEDDNKYRFTISYDPTGGQLGTVTWTQ
jgi:flagellin-like protein